MAALAGRHAEWLERMREARVLDVAAALGVGADTPRSSNAQKWGLPCPVCNAETRHTRTRDKRGAVGIRTDGKGWRCFQCDASGDAIDYVAARLHGTQLKKLSNSAKADVRDWCQRFTGTSAPSPASSSARSRAQPRPSPARPPSAPRPEPAPNYPPLDEVAALWRVCVPVTDAPKVAAWLQSKRLDAQAVADRDLARALQPGASTPDWACRWAQRGYQLIVQQVDARGLVRSVKARNVIGAEPKSLPPYSFEKRGLVMACRLGREVLATGRRPEWWPDDLPLRFEVCEGEKKFCQRVTLCPSGAPRGDAGYECDPIVFGVESGSWTDEIAARIPDDSTVFVAADPDPKGTGAKYATKIVGTFDTRWLARKIVLEPIDEFDLARDPKTNALVVRVRKPSASAVAALLRGQTTPDDARKAT